ncbi:hypothetical protein IB270_31615 [Ensifer sp. ENS05]|uniref:hypothetical protein n=1 Tax=Ensifer sp. ENS05 TaxID=2769277 RepID=UPI0017824EB4|nr:hypothetical protein [Ensifer sp. ENS05]MBD9597381.1 hypothetical protein [Ensifer sp. ENS05]
MPSGELFAKASAEIIEFHRFFVAWYNSATASKEDFSRCEQVLGAGFHIVPPSGAIFDRAQTIELIRSNYASFHGDFAITIEDIQLRWEAGSFALLTYVEAQRRGGDTSRRLATALFEECSSAPCGVQWQHLHETWVQVPGM